MQCHRLLRSIEDMFWSKKLALGTNPNPDRQDIWMVEKIRSNPYERTLTPNSGSGGLSPSENYKRSQQVRIRIFHQSYN